MMRIKLFVVFLLAFNLVFSQPYSVPESIRTKYYYQPGDSLIPSKNPSAALIKILRGWNYLSPDSVMVEPTDGYDTILPLYQFGYKAAHGGFFYLRTEVSNAAYRRFVQSTENPSNTPDTGCWINENTYSEPYVHFYYQHPAYDNFPVCGVSYIQAIAYCSWLQDSINRILAQKNIPQRVVADLPSSDEWINIYYHAVRQYGQKQKIRIPSPTYLHFSMPGNAIHVVSGNWLSARLSEIKPQSIYRGYTAAIDGLQPIGSVYHIIGNVAEWTRSEAKNHLFNHKEYTYTVTGLLVPNIYEKHSKSTLDKYVRGENLNNLKAVKGGSWLDDPFYLQPGALYFAPQNQSRANIGFRPIIRVVNP